MQVTITREDMPTRRQRWELSFIANWHRNYFYLDHYVIETKRTPRCKKWTTLVFWNRLDHRYNTVGVDLPQDVLDQARTKVKESIDETPITW